MMARCLIVLAFWAAVFAPFQAAHPQSIVDPDDAMLFELKIGKILVAEGIGANMTRAGLCLDLQDMIKALQLPLTVSADGQTLQGWAFDLKNQIQIDRSRNEARFGSSSDVLAKDIIWQSNSGWCVAEGQLGRWLGVRFEIDTANATLMILSDHPLPIEAKAQRAVVAERLKAIAPPEPVALPVLPMPYRFWRTPSLDVTAQLGARRDHDRPMVANAKYELLAAGELAYFSSDARLVSDDQGTPQAFRLRLYREDLAGHLLGPLRATEFALGDVVSNASMLSSNAMPGRGLTMTNRPLNASTRNDAIDLTGISPSGWDTELYRNGELIQAMAADASGRYFFRDIPLLAGPNDFEIVQYGPQGQVRREKHSYQIAAQMPTKGETWWSTALVQDDMDLLQFSRDAAPGRTSGQWRFDASVIHGFGKGSAVSAGLHSLARAGRGRLTIAEAGATTTMQGVVLDMTVARARDAGMAYRAKALAQILGTSLSLETIRNRGLVSERLDVQHRAITQFAADRTVFLGSLIVPVHFDLRAMVNGDDRTLALTNRLSVITRRFAMTGLISLEQTRSPAGLSRNDLIAGLLFNGRIGQVRLRGETTWKIGPVLSAETASVTADFDLARNQSMNASLGYADLGNSLYAGVNYSRDLGFAALTAAGQLDNHRNMMVSLGLQFSMGPNGRGRFGRVQSAPRAAAGQIVVDVFRDQNGNGQRDPDEAFIKSPGLMVNGVSVDAEEKEPAKAEPQLVKSLLPAVPVRLTLDETGLENPFDISSSPGVTIIPRAGLVTHVALGIAGTSTIEGRLVRDGRDAGGILIELINLAGQVIRSQRSDFDGVINMERVAFGQYHLQIARRGAEPLKLPLTVSQDRPTIRLGRIEIGAAAERP